MSGYSSTPLARKLGLKTGHRVLMINAPDHYFKLFSDLPADIEFVKEAEEGTVDFIHLFCQHQKDLEEHAKKAKTLLKKDGLLWVSWPKGKSKIQTDLKREPVRDHLLSIGLVDTKVAAIDKDWSGLKFVYRLEDR